MTNTGKHAEAEFERYWAGHGKAAFLHRMTDASEVRGLNKGRPTAMRKQPADYILTAHGLTGFAEVKSTGGDRFDFSLIKPFQFGCATRTIQAGGRYDIFVRRLHPTNPGWFKVPFETIAGWPRKSMTWADLEIYRVDIPVDQTTPRIT